MQQALERVDRIVRGHEFRGEENRYEGSVNGSSYTSFKRLLQFFADGRFHYEESSFATVSAAGQSFESQGAPVVTDGTWAVEPYEGQPVLVLSVNGEKVAGLPFEGDGDAVRIAGQVYRRSAL